MDAASSPWVWLPLVLADCICSQKLLEILLMVSGLVVVDSAVVVSVSWPVSLVGLRFLIITPSVTILPTPLAISIVVSATNVIGFLPRSILIASCILLISVSERVPAFLVPFNLLRVSDPAIFAARSSELNPNKSLSSVVKAFNSLLPFPWRILAIV